MDESITFKQSSKGDVGIGSRSHDFGVHLVRIKSRSKKLYVAQRQSSQTQMGKVLTSEHLTIRTIIYINDPTLYD